MESFNKSIVKVFEQKQTRVFNNSGTEFAKEENAQSDEMWQLKSKLINKQIVLIACKKDETYCDGIKAEIRVIERQIQAQEEKEKVTDKQFDDIPF